jgi:PAS domain S-box-containing protein
VKGYARNIEVRMVAKNGQIIDGLFSAEPITINNKKCWLTVMVDVTEQKRVEEMLRRTEQNFRQSLDESPLGVRIVTPEGETIYANRAILDINDCESLEELKATPVEDRYTPESFAEHQIRREKRKRGDYDPSEYDISIVRKDGEVRHLHVFRKDILWNDEKHFQVLYNDITYRKTAEETLRESEEKWRSLVSNSPDFIALHDREGRYLFLNRYAEGFTEKNVLGKKAIEFVSQESRELYRTKFEECICTMTKQNTEYSAMGDFTKARMYESTFVPIINRGNEINVLVVARDITDRKRTEEWIHASLREKELLLGEVHHRVKNNMQVISGLLDLQARSSGNPELTERLNESQNRIRSMALIHEKLYGSKDFSRIDLAGYVRVLSQELFQTYKINQWKIALIVQTDGDVYVDINKAIPCGLILNELISNALKHAFPGGRQGELQIIIREMKDTEIEIVVRDNGLGLPGDVDIHEPLTIGLYLVNGLVKNQLDGQIEVRRDNGTEFRITFPL